MKKRERQLVEFSFLLAIEALFCFTIIGSIPIGPMVATLAMIPVVVTAVLLGTLYGSIMGFFTGLFSFIVWTFMPPNAAIAFVYTPFVPVGAISGNFFSLIICFLPRILTGTFSGLISKLLKKKAFKRNIVYIFAGIIGSLTNTVLVLLGTWLFFGDLYQEIDGRLMGVIIFNILITNGILELIVTSTLVLLVCRPIELMNERIS